MANIENLRKIQLELLQRFILVCQQNNLKWYASHGTLLGAVRESGYLVWDDDIDIIMPEEDYNILLSNKSFFSEPYYLQTPTDAGYWQTMHLRKDGTTAFNMPLYDLLRKGGHMGICIDILPLVEIGESGFYNLSGFPMPKSYFEPYQIAAFEALPIRIPAKARKVLTQLYGYWNWPCGCEKVKPQHNWFFDPDTDYSVYVERYTGWLKASINKKIYLFGAADSLRIWLQEFGLAEQVICTFDNDASKWGKKAYGVEIRNPVEIPQVLDDNSCMIIVSIWHQEIGRQLESIGVKNFYVFLDGLFNHRK